MTVFDHVQKEDLQKLKGCIQQEPTSLYEQLRLTKLGVTLILYTSGKLLLQGSPQHIKSLLPELEKHHIGQKQSSQHFTQETGIIIGSDESLKGDTFGGIVVAAVKADNDTRKKLKELGVADSKTLSDTEILPLAEKIKHLVPCEIISLLPEEYNNYLIHHNITHLLNKLHDDCARYLKPGKHIVDKYPGCQAGNNCEEKAESKYVEVAAASILARAAALHQLNYLSSLAGFTLPKGSTHVLPAVEELKKRNHSFAQFIKVDFKNVKEFLKK